MLPRNKYFALALLVFLLMLPAGASTQDSNILIRFYQDHISVVDGNRCPMIPSCSQYAAEAVKKHGALMGWIMTCDRLLRCGRDETKISPTVYTGNVQHTYDPVAENDFWWFNDETRKK